MSILAKNKNAMFGGGLLRAGRGGRTRVYLVAGQSNATPRAAWDSGVDYPTDGTVLQIGRADDDGLTRYTDNTDGEIINAVRPLDHWNQVVDGGFGWALQFSLDHLAARPNDTVLLVPAARTGSGFSSNQWNPGDTFYEDAVSRVNTLMSANPSFVFGGILWHQGEQDAALSQSAYATALDAAMNGFRSDITVATASTPIVLGQLADDFSAAAVKAAITDTPNRLAYTAVVDTTGLATQDGTHFTAAAYRTMGSDYYDALATAATNAPAVPDAVDDLAATAGDTQVTLAWSAPAANLSDITDYVVEYSDDGGSNWSTFADGTSATTGATVTSLSNGTEYTFRVYAVNGIGTGAASNTDTATPDEAASLTPESGAAGHWVFGSDYATYEDLLTAQTLSEEGTAPTHNTGYDAITAGVDNGLRSGISDTATLTMCAVVRVQNGTGQILTGNLSSINTGSSIFYSAGALKWRSDPGGTPSVVTIDSSMPENAWVFVAFSRDDADDGYVGYRGDSTASTVVTGTSTRGTVAGTLGVGDLAFNNGGVASAFDVAEFIVFTGAKTEAELDAIYARSQTRMTARGLSLT